MMTTPGPPRARTSPTEAPDPFYGTRVVVMGKSDFADEIICDVRTDVRHLSEVCENDEISDTPGGNVVKGSDREKFSERDTEAAGGTCYFGKPADDADSGSPSSSDESD